jgi:hypothetical protein
LTERDLAVPLPSAVPPIQLPSSKSDGTLTLSSPYPPSAHRRRPYRPLYPACPVSSLPFPFPFFSFLSNAPAAPTYTPTEPQVLLSRVLFAALLALTSPTSAFMRPDSAVCRLRHVSLWTLRTRSDTVRSGGGWAKASADGECELGAIGDDGGCTHHAPRLPTPHAPTAQLAAAPTSAERVEPPPVDGAPSDDPRTAALPPAAALELDPTAVLPTRENTKRRPPTLEPATIPNNSA